MSASIRRGERGRPAVDGGYPSVMPQSMIELTVPAMLAFPIRVERDVDAGSSGEDSPNEPASPAAAARSEVLGEGRQRRWCIGPIRATHA